ncbi:endonuclease/exonuclease/phosphatase family protein [uncultured Draconibacterium sp.]|uniref:endonuclease/exonuclease/phosphatase family protein n=1 Tax=uncultured Draconibacterium sp. TaxID=1573823 RepID=UPI0025E197EF|nr:endonuclease/exonuclease/phosphatase family protein [uncultured Draconibacterium sp.]
MKITKLLLSILTIVFTFNALSAQNTSENEITVRVLTFNILHGATTKGDFDLDKIASVIRNTNPDLVAMQEVDFKTNRARNYDLVTELGWRTKMSPLFGIAMPYDGGGYGEGILTKMPILSSQNVPLPHSPENEPRAALQVLVQLESGDTISFIGTHLEHQETSSDRIDQVNTINEVFASCKYPSILAGDLNAIPNSEPISILNKYWTASDQKGALTYPSDDPEIKIDYIFFRPAEKWQVVETKVICDEIASDHCAVLSVLKLVK